MENVLESTLWEMLKLGVLTTDENEKVVENIKIELKRKMIVSPIADNHFCYGLQQPSSYPVTYLAFLLAFFLTCQLAR